MAALILAEEKILPEKLPSEFRFALPNHISLRMKTGILPEEELIIIHYPLSFNLSAPTHFFPARANKEQAFFILPPPLPSD